MKQSEMLQITILPEVLHLHFILNHKNMPEQNIVYDPAEIRCSRGVIRDCWALCSEVSGSKSSAACLSQ